MKVAVASALSAVVLAATSAAVADGQPPRRVGPEFHAVTAQAPLTQHDIRMLRQSGVGAVRFMVSWQATEVRPGSFDWSATDAFITAIAEAGAQPLPFVAAAPGWLSTNATGDPMSTAEARDDWQRFATAVARRYGPGGSFSRLHPNIAPVGTWQLWNEPNLEAFWGARPSPRSYARMAAIGSAAIRSVDPGARIMLAGLAPAANGMRPWTFLRRLLGTINRTSFDTVALHPYASTIAGAVAQVKRSRRAMRAAGAGALPIAVTEIGWGSSRSIVRPLAGTLRGQARRLRRAYRIFSSHRRWRISQMIWYSLRDSPFESSQCGFCTATGLLRSGGAPKPAWREFMRSIARLSRHSGPARAALPRK